MDVTAYAAPAAENQPALPFRGTIEATETHTHTATGTVLIHGVGTSIATQLGRSTLEFDLVSNLTTFATETSLSLTAPNGDVLTATGTGQATLAEDFQSISLAETYTITGGTGRFADASGRFVLERVVDFTLGSYPSTGSFTGSITLRH